MMKSRLTVPLSIGGAAPGIAATPGVVHQAGRSHRALEAVPRIREEGVQEAPHTPAHTHEAEAHHIPEEVVHMEVRIRGTVDLEGELRSRSSTALAVAPGHCILLAPAGTAG